MNCEICEDPLDDDVSELCPVCAVFGVIMATELERIRQEQAEDQANALQAMNDALVKQAAAGARRTTRANWIGMVILGLFVIGWLHEAGCWGKR